MSDTYINNGSLLTTGTTGTTTPSSGTSEAWTVNPLATAWPSVASPVTMSIQDPAASSEIIRITASSGSGDTTITVTRGADGTTPVAHATGATFNCTVVASALNGLLPTSSAWVDVQYVAAGAGDTIVYTAAANVQSGNYAPVAGDVNGMIEMTNATGSTLTLDSGIFSAGQVFYVCMAGTGAVTFVGSGVTIDSPSGLVTDLQWGETKVRFRSATEAVITENLF